MVTRGFGELEKVVVELREPEVNDRFLGVGADERTLEALDGFAWTARNEIAKDGQGLDQQALSLASDMNRTHRPISS